MAELSTERRDPKPALLRHAVATLAYRGAKAVRDAPPAFATFRIGATTRTPVEILAHVGDLLEWALGLAKGEHRWRDAAPSPWPQEVNRFFETLARFDELGSITRRHI